jgi:transposase
LVATVTGDGLGPAVQLPGALDRSAFDTFVAALLVPALRPGQVVIWDNLSVHKSAHARQLIEAAGCRVLPLPRYSPDYNPIELVFAKLKTVLCRAQARSFDAVARATGAALATITAAEARRCFAAAGYPLPGHHL